MCNRRLLGWLVAGILLAAGCPTPSGNEGPSEEVVRHNIRGTAYLSQQKWSEAESAFRQALELRPRDPLLLNNLAVALMQQGRNEEAVTALRQALAVDPAYPQSHYNLGLILKNDGDFEEAATHFEAVAAFDPDDLLTQYNLGSVLSRIGRDADAEAAFRHALEDNPTHVSTLYSLGRFLIQKGDAAEGQRLIELSQAVRARSGLDEAVGSQYGEQGPYAMGVDYAGDVLEAPEGIPLSFSTGAGESGVTAWVLTRLEPGNRPALLAAVGGALRALSPGSAGTPSVEGLPTGLVWTALAAGDANNDGTVDLAGVARDGGQVETLHLLMQDPDGGFVGREAFTPSGITGASGDSTNDLTFVDADHDGDLDLFWCFSGAAAAACRLAVNDGTGAFAIDPDADHGLTMGTRSAPGLRVAMSDVDNDRDIDLLVASGSDVQVFANQRDGSFEDVSDRLALGRAAAVSLSVADVNKDGWMDLLLAGETEAELWINRRGRFEAPVALPGGVERRLVVADLDNDGFLDVVGASGGPPVLLRNTGRGKWSVVADLLAPAGKGTEPVAALDADGDGDLDLAVASNEGALTLLINDGGNARHWVSVESRGVGDNKYGIGAKVEVLAGALRQKFEIVTPLPLHAGLGQRETVESLRYLWPSGVLQDEIDRAGGAVTEVTQLDRKGTSCPLLYAWRGGRWHFVTDFLGGAAVGYQHSPGSFNTPDTDEYVKIEGGLEADPDGLLRLRLNNQLEEVIWFDRAELVVVDHPAGSQVFPNERLMPGPPWPPFELFVSDDVRPVAAARDPRSDVDWTAALAETDGSYVTNFAELPYKGYAESHALEIDLGPFPAASRAVLLLDGWIDYADSSSNIAAAQAGRALQPPVLEVADGSGGWRGTGHLMGFPAGLPKTMAVELSGLFAGEDHRLRITTNMRIYWDRARLLLGEPRVEPRVQRLTPLSADLRAGGFPEALRASGTGPTTYDPERVRNQGGWKAHSGVYSPYGDVGPLLRATDDRFVTTRNGDEIELRFRSPGPVPEGFARTFLFFADGFGKDMDPNSAANDAVAPIPFHGMPTYPYDATVVPPVAQDSLGRNPRLVLPSEHGWPGALPQPLAARLE